MNNRPGVRISLEGIDGTGKSTLAKWLVEELNRYHIDTIHTREPGGTLVAEELRNTVLSGEGTTALTQALIMSASRSDLYSRLVIPAINESKVVISERNELSTLVYQFPIEQQCTGEQIEEATHLTALVRDGTGICRMPGITLLLDADPAKLMDEKRIHTPDELTGYDEVDIFERLRGRSEGYKLWFDTLRSEFYSGRYLWLNESFVTIDANQSLEQVKVQIMQVILPVINRLKEQTYGKDGEV